MEWDHSLSRLRLRFWFMGGYCCCTEASLTCAGLTAQVGEIQYPQKTLPQVCRLLRLSHRQAFVTLKPQQV